MPTPLNFEAHDLLVRPKNTSLILDAAHHAIFRPLNFLMNKATGGTLRDAQFGGIAGGRLEGGHQLPHYLDPREWGAAASRFGEKLDYMAAPAHPAFKRTEQITLENKHLKDIGAHLDNLHASDPSNAANLEAHLNSVVADHYNNGENIRSLVQKAHADDQFKATLHGVEVKSLTGEAGATVKRVGTDVAAAYGAGEIMDRVHHATHQTPSNEKGTMDKMSKLQEAARSLEKVASILESIPRKDAAYKQANRLLEAGLITEAELEKHAGIFERNPDDAEVIANGMLRGSELENKSASLGEPIYNDATRTTSQGGAFEAMCREGLGMR